MYFVWLGALLELAGMVFLVIRVIADESEPQAIPGSDTVEPPSRGTLSFKGSWPGIAMLALGALLLLVGGKFS